MNKSSIYILIKDSVSTGHAVLAAAHASLSGYLTFMDYDLVSKVNIDEWVNTSFRKVICKVTESEFNEAKDYGVVGIDYRVMTESSLGNAEVAIVFKPRSNWEPFFKKLPLYK